MELLHSGSREEPGKPVKTIFHNADGSMLHTGTIRTDPAARADQQVGHTVRLKKHISAKMPGKGIVSAMPKKQAEYAARASRQMAVKSARAVGEAAQSVKKTARLAVKGIAAVIKAAVSSTKALTALAAAGGGLAVFFDSSRRCNRGSPSVRQYPEYRAAEPGSDGLYPCDSEVCTAVRYPGLCTGHTGHHDAGIQGAGQ